MNANVSQRGLIFSESKAAIAVEATNLKRLAVCRAVGAVVPSEIQDHKRGDSLAREGQGQMQRLQRVLQLLLHLQSGPRFNQNSLAGTFGVSVRTIYRDIDFLRKAGIPIVFDSQADAYRLPEDYQAIRPTGAASQEIWLVAVAAWLSPLAKLPLFESAIEEGVSLLLNESPAAQRRQAVEMMAQLGWLPTNAPAIVPDPNVWSVLWQAIQSGGAVRLTLEETEELHHRALKPEKLLVGSEGWTLTGRFPGDDAEQTVPLTLIRQAELA